MELRPYQDRAIADYQAVLAAGRRAPILVAPTGSGKTVIFCEIIRQTVAQRKNVLVIAHRREIIAQTSGKLAAAGIGHGIIQAGYEPRPLFPVQVASIATLWSRAVRSDVMPMPPCNLLVVDEAHHSVATTYSKVIKAYPEAIVLGATATPCRGDGRGLGSLYDCIVESPQIAALIEQKFLVPTRIYAPFNPNLTGVRTLAGDYVRNQLETRMDKPELVGDIVQHWHRYGERRKTVVFGCSVGHSVHIRDEFIRSGVRAEHIDGTTPKDERDEVLGRLASGKTEVVSNCMVLTEGWDAPDIGCLVLARPTKQLGLYRQMVGRVLRPAQGKADAIVLDHSGAVFRLGFPEDEITWTLDEDEEATNASAKKRAASGECRVCECPKCQAMRLAGQPCPACGYLPAPVPRYVEVRDGELHRIDRNEGVVGSVMAAKKHAHETGLFTAAEWHGMLATIAGERGYKDGWIAHKFKERFGKWPPRTRPPMLTPSPEVRAWVRARQVEWWQKQRASG